MPIVDVARPYSHPQGRANLAPCWGSCTHPAHGFFTLPSCSQAWPSNELYSQCLQGQPGQQPAPVPGSTYGFLEGQSLCSGPGHHFPALVLGRAQGTFHYPWTKRQLRREEGRGSQDS